MGCAALYSEGTGDRGDDSSDDLEDLLNSGPFQFHFEHGFYGLNG